MEALIARALALVALLLVAVLLMGFTWIRMEIRRRFGTESIAVRSLDRALAEASVVARDAVLYTQQTFASALKERSADGKLTAQEAAEAMERAWEYFQSHLSENSYRVLEAAFGPLEDWAKGLMEAKVGETKLLASLPKAP